jgi:hypothetical protein
MSDTEMIEELEFLGIIKDGSGNFSAELEISGSDKISTEIPDWPKILQPGTLNVRIEKYPDCYEPEFGQLNVKCLDSRKFQPVAEIPHSDIKNNTLPPTPEFPDRGRAQIWQAILTKLATEKEAKCWVFRRIGSGMQLDLELVSDHHLRNAMSLENGDKVSLKLFGCWERK